MGAQNQVGEVDVLHPGRYEPLGVVFPNFFQVCFVQLHSRVFAQVFQQGRYVGAVAFTAQ